MKTAIRKFDAGVGEWVASWSPSWYGFLAWLCVVVSPVGWVLVAIAGTILALQLHNQLLAILSIGVLVALPLSDLIKVIVRRPRPISMYVDSMRLRSYSFPSTHAYAAGLGSGYVVLYLAEFMAGTGLYLAGGLLAALAVVVSLARVYLKAHFPSDVVVGLGLGWVVIAVLYIGLI